MCGILGVLSRDYSPLSVSEEEICRMRDRMYHRGPDGCGVWIDQSRGIGLAHRRLAIVDLDEAASQPMIEQQGAVALVFNGEIYNHLALRKELVNLDYEFVTDHSDTEVLVHGYLEWGLDGLLHRLQGDYAFGIWDSAAGLLHLARDRIGVKPLYFYLDEKEVVFASEIKAIVGKPGFISDVDTVALNHYLSFLTTPAPLTMFKGVYKLPPGTSLTFDKKGNSQSCKYWDPARNQIELPHLDVRRPEQQEKFQTDILDILKRSIDKRMMSDVPFGVFLSGGVDSSTNVALMSQLMSEPVKTFTVGFKEHTHLNELREAELVSRHFATDHHEILIDEQDMIGYLEQLVESQDEPLADWVCIPLYFVSRLTKQSGTTVIQVGEGADEQFSGYSSYMQYLEIYNKYWRPYQALMPGVGRRAIAAMFKKTAQFKPGIERYADFAERAALGGDCFWSGAHAMSEIAKRRLMSYPDEVDLDQYREILKVGLITESELAFETSNVIRTQKDYFVKHSNNQDILAEMAYKELSLRLPELLLMRVDKITMSNSLEARVPFLDDELVSYTMSIPWRNKVWGNQPKAILKRAVEPLLPKEIIYRKKMGFGAPMTQWLRGEFGYYVEDVLLNSEIMNRGLFDKSYIEELIHQHRDGRADNSLYIWTLFNLFAWYDFWVTNQG